MDNEKAHFERRDCFASGLRIRIHFIWSRIQHFRLNTDPDPIRIRIRIRNPALHVLVFSLNCSVDSTVDTHKQTMVLPP
jgi:hypothetical protein